MAVSSDHAGSLAARPAPNRSTPACVVLVLSVLILAAVDRNLPLAVYLLSFWHYYLYWLAFAFGAAAFDVFKRDAVAMKVVSVLLLATVYLAAPISVVSLAVIGGGILLNVRAALVLGIDRTYYGHEVAGLPPCLITAFPYSLTGHPMILGNVAAFGGTLLNPTFREQWWALACLHVVLNVALLAMELAGPQRRAVRVGGALVLGGAMTGAAFAALAPDGGPTVPTALAAMAVTACASVLYRCHAPPRHGGPRQTEGRAQ
jgi:hypothetical protein